MTKLYNSASDFYKKIFDQRVQKISVDAGFTCPNRDGSKARGGCTYCNNDTFKPFYCTSQKTITQQLSEGIDFFAKKYKTQKYLAYFQAFSNTYAPLDKLKKLYSEALSLENVVGLVIATRPDCVDEYVLDYLAKLSEKYFVLLEFGVETVYNASLERINRAHSFEDSVKALNMSAQRNLMVGVHLILGLPGETKQMMLDTAKEISKLPFTLLKLHQLQIVRGTQMFIDYSKNPQNYSLFGLDEYIDFCVDFLEYLKPEIYVERFTSETPKQMLIAPLWGGVKNYEIVHKIESRLRERKTFQGAKYLNN